LPYFTGVFATIYVLAAHIYIPLKSFAMEALDGTEFTGGNVGWNSHGSTDLQEIGRGVEFS
jgi:hypothetical protein